MQVYLSSNKISIHEKTCPISWGYHHNSNLNQLNAWRNESLQQKSEKNSGTENTFPQEEHVFRRCLVNKNGQGDNI